MAPSGRRRARRITRKQPRRTSHRISLESKICSPSSNFSTTTSPDNSSKIDSDDYLGRVEDHASTSGCSTPKAQRFRIPEIVTCPPAPKKRRVLSNCSLQRSPIAFFAPPDLELFFFFALQDISV
ncbi:cyclin-dependent protein kinase inhibitor SMR9-like [Malania oleifera]|uniref:cyclin-dependent protein kinase inhibitor SMR9-like n=1 Tax=Malania oleifera TaxID=397392 RepID=UPI0025AE06BE|nr:cyclin-dependent protein kinase inhibitor SMR9-like [Malania oleifera]